MKLGEIIERFMIVRNPDFPFNMFVECGEIDMQFMIGKHPVEINCAFDGEWSLKLSKVPYDFSPDNVYGDCIIGDDIEEIRYNDANCITILGESSKHCTTIVIGE